MQKASVPFTKILATLGPATTQFDKIKSLVQKGVDAFRVNASHGSHESHLEAINIIREVEKDLNRPLAILYDLQGPKIRVSQSITEGIDIQKGNNIIIYFEEIKISEQFTELTSIPINYKNLSIDVKKGNRILIDDGNIGCLVENVYEGFLECKVLNSGKVMPRKGINFPDSELSLPALTPKDEKDLKFAIEKTSVDVIALSFVQHAKDILLLKSKMEEYGKLLPIVAKIEKPQAIEQLEEIYEESWGIMIARGDLGVELSPEEVPVVQKRMIQLAIEMGKPIITATQLLESMRHSPRPTRAEVSDVANAVLDGTDMVMLSAETATGDYPEETVEMMRKIIVATEPSENFIGESILYHEPNTIPEIHEKKQIAALSITHSACDVAFLIDAKSIVTFTRTGSSAVFLSQRRAKKKHIAITPNLNSARLLRMVWGVKPFVIDRAENIEHRLKQMEEALIASQEAVDGDHVVLVMSSPKAPAGSTNIIIVHQIGEKNKSKIIG